MKNLASTTRVEQGPTDPFSKLQENLKPRRYYNARNHQNARPKIAAKSEIIAPTILAENPCLNRLSGERHYEALGSVA